MSKVAIVRDSEGLFYGIKFRCQGCAWDDGTPSTCVLPVNWLPPGETEESPHVAGKPHWSFNGDFEKPVLGPSVLSSSEYGPERTKKVCHSFIGCNGAEPGEIIFLSDCTHALAGQTLPLPELDAQ